MDSSKVVRQALEAGEFLQAMGRPMQAEALSMIQNGNVTIVLHSVDDVNSFMRYTVCRWQASEVEPLRNMPRGRLYPRVPLERILEEEKDMMEEAQQQMNPQLRQSARVNAGIIQRDDHYEWNLMNLGVGEVIQKLMNIASNECKAELYQLFIEKKALQPVRWEELNKEQKRKVIWSHMFLKEKYKDSTFDKIKARLVADG